MFAAYSSADSRARFQINLHQTDSRRSDFWPATDRHRSVSRLPRHLDPHRFPEPAALCSYLLGGFPIWIYVSSLFPLPGFSSNGFSMF